MNTMGDSDSVKGVDVPKKKRKKGNMLDWIHLDRITPLHVHETNSL